MGNKIVRSVCIFTDDLNSGYEKELEELSSQLTEKGFDIQTRRLCTSNDSFSSLEENADDTINHISLGKKTLTEARNSLEDFLVTKRTSFCLDLTEGEITEEHAGILFEIIEKNAAKTFDFSYSFNTPNSAPFFNCTNYNENGFSIGLQTTDLAENLSSIDEWLSSMSKTWDEIMMLFGDNPRFLGIDGSVAPLFTGKSSFVNFLRRIGYELPKLTTTDIFTRITRFLKEKNPKPVGMNGLMFPALEDFDLADEYSKGEFTIERNIFLSLHSGLGIDTYPIGIDEKPERVVGILRLVQALSNKYNKHLAVRFVSDGKGIISEKTDFKNEYLKDVVIREL